MSWELYRWVWQLCSPLHIGTTPAGSLNRTRLYIPARNMWAALTAEIARRQSASSFPNYQSVGQELQEHVRFSYLFPAEKVNGRWCAWLPRYQTDKGVSGLFWHREDGEADPVLDRRFRQRLLDTRPGTALVPGSNTAEEATLREFEYVMPHWRPENGYSASQPMAFVGYCLLKNTLPSNLHSILTEIREILIGGESRYGFGHLRLLPLSDEDPWAPAGDIFGATVTLEGANPLLDTPQYLLAHGSLPSSQARGNWEILMQWDWQRLQGENTPLWQPGTRVQSGNNNRVNLMITPNGLWQNTQQTSS